MPVAPGAGHATGAAQGSITSRAVLKRIRYLLADLGHWLANPRWHLLIVPGALLLAGGITFGVIAGVGELGCEDEPPAPAPEIVVREQADTEATEDLGFPAFATRNTTRVSGEDPIADAAGVALATFPSTGGLEGPAAVTLVEENDWPSGIAASVLMSDPVRAPILISGSDDVPDLTQSALEALGPRGSADTGDKQVFRVGAAAAPDGLRAATIEGANPAEIASQIDLVRQRLTKSDPEHLLVTTSDDAAIAMPAAAWAARSGDPVFFVGQDTAPEATLEALGRHKNVPVFVLGSKSEISDGVLKELEKAAVVGAEADRGREPGRERRQVRPLRRRDVRLGRQRSRPRLRDRQHLAARSTRRPPRRSRRAAPGGRCWSPTTRTCCRPTCGLSPRRQARLPGRPDARGLQPPLGDRRRERDLGRRPGADGRAGGAGAGRDRQRPRHPRPAARRARAGAARRRRHGKPSDADEARAASSERERATERLGCRAPRARPSRTSAPSPGRRPPLRAPDPQPDQAADRAAGGGRPRADRGRAPDRAARPLAEHSGEPRGPAGIDG